LDTGLIIAIVVVAVVLLIVLAVVGARIAKRRRESKQLKERFGPEYDRAIEQHGDRDSAERSLRERQERREGLEIRSLSPEQRERYTGEWRNVQARFVDAPQEAVKESDFLVQEVMRQRGYPVDDFDQRAEDISVDHPHVVENYRSAGEIARRNERGEASTEDLRQATVHYRALFEELLEVEVSGASGSGRGGDGGRDERDSGRGNDAGGGGRRGEEVR
jgi:hypothetical protein